MRAEIEEARRVEGAQAFVRSRAEHFGERPGHASRAELFRQAENLDLPGRASMSKEQLSEALRQHAAK